MCAFFIEKGDTMEKYMQIALNEAKKALKKGDIPVGAVVVKDGKIIAKAYNKREKNNVTTHHAEILAINKACKKIHNWRLNDCELYVTMEPCMMCCGAIIQSRISKVTYGTANDNFGFSNVLKENNVKIESGMLENECRKIVQNFFVQKRN